MSSIIPKNQTGSGNENKKISLSLKQKESKSEHTQKELKHEKPTNGHDKSSKDALRAPRTTKVRDSTTNSTKDSNESGTVIEPAKDEQFKNNKQDQIVDDQKNKNGKAEDAKSETNNDSEVISAKVVEVTANENKLEDAVTVTIENESEEVVTTEKLTIAVEADFANANSTETNDTSVKNENVEREVITKEDLTTDINSTFDEEMPSLKVDDASEDGKLNSSGKVLKLKSPISDDNKEIWKKESGRSKTTLIEGPKYHTTRIDQLKTSTSFGRITGRRSFKDLPELSMRKCNYGSYRQSNIDLDNTSSSLNVTVGSEVSNDNSFSFFGFGKKREYTESAQSQSLYSEPERTPKRAKTETNGIINLIKTPISLLRSQFSKTSMNFSTPNVALQQAHEDGVENVSTVDIEEAKSAICLPNEIDLICGTDDKETKDIKFLDSSSERFSEANELCLENKCDANKKTCNVM